MVQKLVLLTIAPITTARANVDQIIADQADEKSSKII
jgi:hypothetical protein